MEAVQLGWEEHAGDERALEGGAMEVKSVVLEFKDELWFVCGKRVLSVDGAEVRVCASAV